MRRFHLRTLPQRGVTLVAIVLVASCTTVPSTAPLPADRTIAEWPAYGGDAGGTRFSPLAQIDRGNVARLKVAWEYRVGDVSDGTDGRPATAFQNTPIVVDGAMYLTTPFGRVIALDAESGKEKWRFDPKADLRGPRQEVVANRGVALLLSGRCGLRRKQATMGQRRS